MNGSGISWWGGVEYVCFFFVLVGSGGGVRWMRVRVIINSGPDPHVARALVRLCREDPKKWDDRIRNVYVLPNINADIQHCPIFHMLYVNKRAG